jgi:hypothetical protein
MDDLRTYEQIIKEITLGPIDSEEESKAVQNTMVLRSRMIERITLIRKCAALRTRAEAGLMQIEESMASDCKEWQKLDMVGRRLDGIAQIKNCDMMTEQYMMELDMYVAMLHEDMK